MQLRSIALIALVLIISSNCPKLNASQSAETITRSTGTKNLNAILKYLLPILRSSEKVGRIYYNATCQADENYPVPFPEISVIAPNGKNAGLAAVRDVFQNNKDIRIVEERPGVVSIFVGKVPATILHTKISSIIFKPLDQYNYDFAFTAIDHSKEVKAARLTLGLRIPSIVTNEPVVQPAEGLPHLPSSMQDITMDQALDSVAKTFQGVVVYGACTKVYTISLAGGVGFDESKL